MNAGAIGAGNPAAAADTRALVTWLEAVRERHDFSLPPPTEGAAVILALLGILSREYRDYGEVISGARAAARRNAEQLREVVRTTGDQGVLIRATATAAAEAENEATRMADAAEALRESAKAAADAAAEAGGGLAAIDGALGELHRRLADGNAPLADMRTSTGGVGDFLITLARLSRHAQLLAVNASIEAAHLAEAGSRFGIVAQEVRKLSVSTRDSKADVAKIVGELRESTEHVAVATRDSGTATSAAGAEIAGAAGSLTRTAGGIGEFEQLVATVADVTGTQSMALQLVSSSIAQISAHADEAAVASGNAAELDLGALVERAHTKAARWTLLRDAGAVPSDGSALADWVAAIASGAAPEERAAIDDADHLGPLATALRALIEYVNGEQRDVLADVIAVAVAVSRNGYAWRSIATSLGGVSHEIGIVRETVAESVAGAKTSAELAAAMRALVDGIRSLYDSALDSLDGALTRISKITESVREIDGYVEAMNAAAARADRIMALIETLSSETDLLSLNAAIEAAHAGELGLGFSVIAEEIRSLARSTNESTTSVSRLVASIARISGDLQRSIGEAAASMSDVLSSAEGVRTAIAALRDAFEAATVRALEVSATALQQTRSLDRVLANVNACATALETNSASSTDKSRLELAMLGSRAHLVAARRPIGTVIERVRDLAESLCVRIEKRLEAALDAGRVPYDRLFDLTYAPIDGDSVLKLGRLFDCSRVPKEGFNPTKYATPWDAFVDEDMIEVLSAGWEEAAGFAPVTIFVSDLNGLFYAYPRQKIAAWTNDLATDNTGNRIKRMFEDEYSLRVGRTGLGPAAAELGPRCTYDAFRAAGCELGRAQTRPWGGFVYARDTSMVCNEVVMALYARDLRHSTLRLCYDPNLI